jgi:hypothetical protein
MSEVAELREQLEQRQLSLSRALGSWANLNGDLVLNVEVMRVRLELELELARSRILELTAEVDHLQRNAPATSDASLAPVLVDAVLERLAASTSDDERRLAAVAVLRLLGLNDEADALPGLRALLDEAWALEGHELRSMPRSSCPGRWALTWLHPDKRARQLDRDWAEALELNGRSA